MMNEIKIKIKSFLHFLSTATFVFLLVLPASTNYKLKDYGFGNGGVSNASSAAYSMNATAGEVSGAKAASAAYGLGSGLVFANQSNVPPAPTLTNPNSYYNKLNIIINVGGNPTDTKFAIAISSDNFVTTNYVKSDNTVAATLVLADYQTYAAWGGASGINILGLTTNTSYKVKVKAMQGKFTETPFGPTATASTVNPTLSFAIRTDTLSSPPFAIDFGTMTTGSVNVGPQKIWADMTTNGESGARVYVSGASGGLVSSTAGYTISSVTGDLNSLGEGFGAQGVSVTQASGGPLAITAGIYSQAANMVGIVDGTVREIFNSVGPITSGSGSFQLKAKPATTARPAQDYTETLKLIVAGSF